MTATTIFQRGTFPEYASPPQVLEPRGFFGISVYALPSGIVMRTRPFIAHELASKMGPSILRRNFIAVKITDGSEIKTKTPRITNGICHHFSDKNPPPSATSAPPIAPIAKPIAAKIPTNFPMSKEVFGAAPAVVVAATEPAPLVSEPSICCSRDEAKPLICDSTKPANLRYGAQIACRREM